MRYRIQCLLHFPVSPQPPRGFRVTILDALSVLSLLFDYIGAWKSLAKMVLCKMINDNDFQTAYSAWKLLDGNYQGRRRRKENVAPSPSLPPCRVSAPDSPSFAFPAATLHRKETAIHYDVKTTCATYVFACLLISSAVGEKKALFWYFAIFSHLPWFSFTSFSLISGTWWSFSENEINKRMTVIPTFKTKLVIQKDGRGKTTANLVWQAWHTKTFRQTSHSFKQIFL